MAAHWPEIAWVDFLFKIAICGLFFLPAYGVILKYLTRKLTVLQQNQAHDAPAPKLSTES